MPVKLAPRLAVEQEARIEIIPLIDIMFFLLAAFILVSLSTVHMKSVKVDLPTATQATPSTTKDFTNVTVDRAGLAYLDAKLVGNNELVSALSVMKSTHQDPRVFISGDQDARHGDVIRVLDLVRSTGIQRVAFQVREPARKP
ncbi:MAG: Biopolymer transport protein [Pseudomonadota bacterium]